MTGPRNKWRFGLVWQKRNGVWGWRAPRKTRRKSGKHKPTGRARGRPPQAARADLMMRMIVGQIRYRKDRRPYWKAYDRVRRVRVTV